LKKVKEGKERGEKNKKKREREEKTERNGDQKISSNLFLESNSIVTLRYLLRMMCLCL